MSSNLFLPAVESPKITSNYGHTLRPPKSCLSSAQGWIQEVALRGDPRLEDFSQIHQVKRNAGSMGAETPKGRNIKTGSLESISTIGDNRPP